MKTDIRSRQNWNTIDLTRDELLHAFAQRIPITLRGVPFTVINKLEHEDGSGQSFNVTGIANGKEATVYLRTSFISPLKWRDL